MADKISFHRPSITSEETGAVTAVMHSGWLTSGPEVAAFEKEFSGFSSAPYNLAVNSCTSGLFLMLKAAGIGPGDEVITSPVTFAASVNVILHCGAIPVFADVELNTGNLNPEEVERKVSPATRAILAVHLGGQSCDMDALTEIAGKHSLMLFEDCAHAFDSHWKGRTLGTLGLAAAFSFYATKCITTGEGGMVTSASEALVAKMKLLRNHGMNQSVWDRSQGHLQPLYDIQEPGYKMNLADPAAAMGRVQLRRWPALKEKLQQIRSWYDDGFKELNGKVKTIEVIPGAEPGWHLYMLRLENHESRDSLRASLAQSQIETSVNYTPLHQLTAFRRFASELPFAEKWGSTILSLPFYSALTQEEVNTICTCVQQWAAK